MKWEFEAEPEDDSDFRLNRNRALNTLIRKPTHHRVHIERMKPGSSSVCYDAWYRVRITAGSSPT